MKSLILLLTIIYLILLIVSLTGKSQASETYTNNRTNTPMPNWANCQSNGYTDGCVFGAYSGGTFYDSPTHCC